MNGLQIGTMPLDEAISLLNELVCDFAFVDKSSTAHAFSAMLLPFVRQMIDGATPLHFDAPARGTGKGLLSDVISLISTGGAARVMVVPRDEDELEKRITATLLSICPYSSRLSSFYIFYCVCFLLDCAVSLTDILQRDHIK